MKKNLFITLAVLSLCACTEKEYQPIKVTPADPEPEIETVTLSLSSVATKTYLSGTSVAWSEGDMIQINGESYTIECSESDTTVTVTAADAYYAFYPAEEATSYDESSHTYTFTPVAEQDGYVKDGASFAYDTNPMVAAITDGSTNLTFHHIFGMLQLRLSGTLAVNSIMMRGNSSVALSGEGFSVAISSDGTGTVTSPETPASVKLTSVYDLPGDFTRTYSFVVPAGTYDSGVSFELCDSEGSTLRAYSTDNSISINAGETTAMPEINVDTYCVLYSTDNSEWSTSIPDLSSAGTLYVKTEGPTRLSENDIWNITYALIDRTDDIEVIMSDAKMAVTDDYGKRIFPTAFAERCASCLTLINLPSNLGELADGAFKDCTKLTEVKIESELYWIGANAFSGCSSLKTIYAFRETPADCGDNAFNGVATGGSLYTSDGAGDNYSSHSSWSVLVSDYSWKINPDGSETTSSSTSLNIDDWGGTNNVDEW